MLETKRTPAGEAMTPLILDLLRLNSMILISGDRLVAELGLTSARWQILGAIDAAERPQPVAWLARDIGGNRQNVQRIVNDLHRDGLVTFVPNPHHRRTFPVRPGVWTLRLLCLAWRLGALFRSGSVQQPSSTQACMRVGLISSLTPALYVLLDAFASRFQPTRRRQLQYGQAP